MKIWSSQWYCKLTRKKFRDFGSIQPMASVLALQCSNQFGCEDPYTRSRPICWVHLNPCIEWNMKMMWTAEIQIWKWRFDWHSGNFNFSNILQIEIRNFFFRDNLQFLNPFAPGDFAGKRVLKLVEWFSGHCRAIKR